MVDETTNAEIEDTNSSEPIVETKTDTATENSEPSMEAGETEPEPGGTEHSVEALLEKVATLEAKITEQSEGVLRAQAEMQNVRRRAENEVSNARKFALERFATDLLPVVDSLERGLESVPEDNDDEQVKSLREGSTLTLKMLLEVLTKFNVQQLDPVGEPFDPKFHEAMSMQENADAEPNSVLAVLQKGYTLNERLIRPAMVVVSKGAAK